MKCSTRFSLTIPSDAAKKARTCLIKWLHCQSVCPNLGGPRTGQLLQQSRNLPGLSCTFSIYQNTGLVRSQTFLDFLSAKVLLESLSCRMLREFVVASFRSHSH